MWCEHQDGKIDFGCRADTAEQFEHDGCYQCALVLVVQGSYLMVDGEQLLVVAISKSPNTFTHPW